MSNILKTATLSDIESLVSLIRAYYTYDHIAFDESEIRRGLPTLLNDPKIGQAWFIQVDGRTAGYVIATYGYDLEFGGREATITDLFLHSEYRRTGLGTRTLQAVEREVHANGASTIELRVENDNHEAIAFYSKLGFQPSERISMSKRLD